MSTATPDKNFPMTTSTCIFTFSIVTTGTITIAKAIIGTRSTSSVCIAYNCQEVQSWLCNRLKKHAHLERAWLHSGYAPGKSNGGPKQKKCLWLHTSWWPRICIQDLNQQQVDKVYVRMVEHLDESLSQVQEVFWS